MRTRFPPNPWLGTGNGGLDLQWRRRLGLIVDVRNGATNPAQLTQPSLLLRMRDPGDHRAWGQFVELYTPLIFGFCQRRGLQEADAADVAQDVLRAVSRSIGQFEYEAAKGSFRSWLFTITRNKFNNFLERRHRHPQGTGETAVHQMLESQPCPEVDDSWDREYHQRLFDWAASQVAKEFKPSTWEAFWMMAVEDKSGQQVAESLGLTIGAVYVARSRVTNRIREKILEATDDAGFVP